MAGYFLYCTVCKTTFLNKQFWNQHLIKSSHQCKAIIDLVSWNEELKQCSVVIYSKIPIGPKSHSNHNGAKIVKYFSNNTFVTDFVISVTRPRIAIIQFESSEEVNKILGSCRNSTVQIQNLALQLRRLDQLLEFEWEELLPSFNTHNTEISTGLTPASSLEHLEAEEISLPVPAAPSSTTSTSSPQNGIPCLSSQAHHIFGKDSHCLYQYHDIMSSMEIPKAEVNFVQNVLEELKRSLGKSLPNCECEVALYRYNFLNLRSNLDNKIYWLYMYNRTDTEIGFQVIPKSLEHQAVSDLVSGTILNPPPFPGLTRTGKRKNYTLTDSRSNVILKISTTKKSIVDMQLSRLTSYYCEFDPRVKSLLKLLYHWISENCLRIGKSNTKKKNPSCVPHPAAFEWILLFFLYSNKKLIPTPKEILDRPHTPLVAIISSKNVDVGFNYDLKWAKTWRENREDCELPIEDSPEYIYSVLELFQEFLQFYGNRIPTTYSVKTRDGVICDLGFGNDEKISKPKRVYVIHPLVLENGGWQLEVDKRRWKSEIIPAMTRTAQKLDEVLKSTSKPNSGSLKNVFGK